jgi:hypothetical protein
VTDSAAFTNLLESNVMPAFPAGMTDVLTLLSKKLVHAASDVVFSQQTWLSDKRFEERSDLSNVSADE